MTTAKPTNAAQLRLRAEESLKSQTNPTQVPPSPADMQRLLHELQVHQIELEMQNEELQNAWGQALEAADLYSALYDFAPVGYFTLKNDGIITQANLAGARLLGLERAKVMNKRLGGFVTAADLPVFNAFLRHAFTAPGQQNCEVTLARVDQTPLIVQIVADISSAGNTCRVVVVDITTSKQILAEKEKLQEKLGQAEKMETVGRLAGGIAHDFNNMLAVIIGNVEMAMTHESQNPKLSTHLKEILSAAEHSADLTKQLLAFARKQPAIPKVLDLNESLTGMFSMLQRLIGENISLEWLPGNDLWKVKMDASQVDQILANLCVNARDAISGTGKVTIKTQSVAIDEANCPGDLRGGNYVLLTVSDDGSGMTPETQRHIFEPFFTTKEMGKGTGLGLATVYGIVKQNHGYIEISSTLGQGTTFKIYLPRYADQAKKLLESEPTIAAGGHELILLVEDEPAIMAMTRTILQSKGYTVLAAATPGDAIRLAEAHPGEIKLLLTDIIMPEMNGRELAEKLRAICPNMKQMFMSGYTADIIADNGLLDEGIYFIQKPFSIADLTRTIRTALDTSQAI